jgi:hypothetical protein
MVLEICCPISLVVTKLVRGVSAASSSVVIGVPLMTAMREKSAKKVSSILIDVWNRMLMVWYCGFNVCCGHVSLREILGCWRQ